MVCLKMKKIQNFILAAIMICGTTVAEAETLRGTVKDAITGEPLIGATVRIVELTDVAAVADIDGNYIIQVKEGGRYTIETNYIGYDIIQWTLNKKDVKIIGELCFFL